MIFNQFHSFTFIVPIMLLKSGGRHLKCRTLKFPRPMWTSPEIPDSFSKSVVRHVLSSVRAVPPEMQIPQGMQPLGPSMHAWISASGQEWIKITNLPLLFLNPPTAVMVSQSAGIRLDSYLFLLSALLLSSPLSLEESWREETGN